MVHVVEYIWFGRFQSLKAGSRYAQTLSFQVGVGIESGLVPVLSSNIEVPRLGFRALMLDDR